MPKSILTRMGDGERVSMPADEVKEDLLLGTQDAAQNGEIPELTTEDLEQIFSRFYQSESGNKHSKASSGLGLHIAKKIVEAHGGKIWAESEVGQGTTITCLLPLAAPQRS